MNKKNKIYNKVTDDLLSAAKLKADVQANDFMTKTVVAISKGTPLKKVAQLLLADRVSAYPVIDSENKVIGIITISDLFTIIDDISSKQKGDFDEQINAAKEKTVMEVMSMDVATISPMTTLKQIVQLIVAKNIHTFPVIENDKLVGIIGRHDVLNAVFSEQG